jgi:3-dehydroshikimate dehydratase
MKLSICTISFRHQLVSIDQLVHWAKANHFQGIELWGVHAKNLSEQPSYNRDWLAGFGLFTSMISDYLPLQGPETIAFQKVQQLCLLAKHWGATKLRTFAGHLGSHQVSDAERDDITRRMQDICQWTAQHGITLIVEIHPGTLADTMESTVRLLKEVNQPNLKINFDVLHVWESGANPIEAFHLLKQDIEHFHLKNISSAELLSVFSPPNVYSASGSREGLVPLFEGAVDYQAFLEFLMQQPDQTFHHMDASLEWFGDHCKKTLSEDRYKIQQLQQTHTESGLFYETY